MKIVPVRTSLIWMCISERVRKAIWTGQDSKHRQNTLITRYCDIIATVHLLMETLVPTIFSYAALAIGLVLFQATLILR